MHYIIVQLFKSNKPAAYTSIVVDSHEQAKERAKSILDGSVDIQTVEIFELVASASKVEVVQWN